MTVATYVAIMRAAMRGRGDKWTARPDVAELVALRHGPYRPLRAKVGDVLTCSVWGCPVRVDGISTGAIPWPCSKQRRVGALKGPRHLVVTGELERAVRAEEAVAVAHHWGSNVTTLYTWKQALGVRGAYRGFDRYRHACAQGASARPLRRALFFLRRSGCRTCELRAMRWRHVDWEAGVVRLAEHKTARTTSEVRLIGMDRATLRFAEPAASGWPQCRGSAHVHQRPRQALAQVGAGDVATEVRAPLSLRNASVVSAEA
jgi:hypothetical protein